MYWVWVIFERISDFQCFLFASWMDKYWLIKRWTFRIINHERLSVKWRPAWSQKLLSHVVISNFSLTSRNMIRVSSGRVSYDFVHGFCLKPNWIRLRMSLFSKNVLIPTEMCFRIVLVEYGSELHVSLDGFEDGYGLLTHYTTHCETRFLGKLY